MDTSGLDKDGAIALYDDEDRAMVRLIAAAKAPGVSRAEEIVAFVKAAGYRRVGIAHCVAVTQEAEALEQMLAGHCAVTRVGCKVFEIPNAAFVEGQGGTACNPVGR